MSGQPSPPSLRRRRAWKEEVRRGWNRASFVYRPRRATQDLFGHASMEYREWLRPLLTNLPRGARVLDLGCGNGIPAAQLLSTRFRLTGVDVSDTQLRRARRLVPGAHFLRADLAEVDFAPESFEAVLSLYALIHVPREEHRAVFRRVFHWLAPGGWFLVIVGEERYEGRQSNWLGSEAPMRWSHYDAATYRRWFPSEGFRIVRDSFVPEGDGGHRLFLARKRRRRTGTP